VMRASRVFGSNLRYSRVGIGCTPSTDEQKCSDEAERRRKYTHSKGGQRSCEQPSSRGIKFVRGTLVPTRIRLRPCFFLRLARVAHHAGACQGAVPRPRQGAGRSDGHRGRHQAIQRPRGPSGRG
jgi:hypothetical protein